MKKTVLHAALFAMSMPMSLYALGLGEMTVKSSLNQPFLAEIELIDVGSAPLPGIKVGVADPENFEQIGIERTAVLSLLNFKIEKNKQGKFVITVQSLERMTEPYMELVVDLTWPNGQLYKAYTVLLDPPGYQLVATTAQSSPTHYKKVNHFANEPGVINKTIVTNVEHNPVVLNDGKKKTTYGPTITNENVWQIAQRYKTSEVILPQVVLAIVGENPDAFKEGNLNGLKVGVRLVVPATREIMQVPSELATQEVMAHDKAWNEKTVINHVISPPYMNAQTINATPEVTPATNSSEISPIPKLTVQSVLNQVQPQLIPANTAAPVSNSTQQQSMPTQTQQSQNANQDALIKAELSITTSAVESVRESNALLMEQLHLLQDQNKKLQQQLDKRDKDIERIRAQMEVMMKERLAVAGQSNSANSKEHSSSYWPLFLLLLLGAGGGGAAYWYFRMREQEHTEPATTDTASEGKPFSPLMEPKKLDVKDEVVSADSASAEEGKQLLISPQQTMINSADKESTPSDQDNSSTDAVDIPHKEAKKTSRKKKKEAPVVEVLPNAESLEDITKPANTLETTPSSVENKDSGLEFNSEFLNVEPANNEEQSGELNNQAENDSYNTLEQNPGRVEQEEEPLEFKQHPQDESEELPQKEKNQAEDNETHDLLEFESGLHELIKEKPAQSTLGKETKESDDEGGIDFVLSTPEPEKSVQKDNESGSDSEDESIIPFISEHDPSDHKKESPIHDIDQSITDFFKDNEENSNLSDDSVKEVSSISESDADMEQSSHPLKSTKALNTLLELARTYIGMEDYESARHSLDEVLEHGNKKQKEEATRLLEQIKDQ